VADDKKFDPDKTAVDIPAAPSTPPADTGDKTVVMQRPAAPPPSAPAADGDKTMVTGAHAAPAPRQAPDVDKTMVGGAAPAAATGPVNFELICLAGSARGRRFALRGEQTLIGSSPSCQVVMPGIESVHVRLHEGADGVELQNLGTAGSVTVSGGRAPERTKLKSGDLVKVGDVVFRLVRVGEVFSSEYSEAELTPNFLGNFLDPEALKANWRRIAIGTLVVLAAGVFFWSPVGPRMGPTGQPTPSQSEQAKQKQVIALFTVGETLFNAGKYIAPADQPDAENAYAKFNEILSLDPGNEKARLWLTRIDKKLEEEKSKREDAEKRKAAAAQEQREQQRKALEARVKVLIDQGDELYKAGQVAEPAGRNALVFYREALKVDDQSPLARAAIAKGIGYYVDNGDKLRESGDDWKALEQYRKASRASEGKEPEVEARVRETETILRSGMGATGTYLVMYKDDRGQVVVLDEMEKVPARYRDRAVEIRPSDNVKKPQ
jgi:tetratricopeptide (TPR) repeat protein